MLLQPRRAEVHLRGSTWPDDMALCSWQIKYLNNKAELRLTVHLDNVGLRSTITHCLQSAFTKEYIFSSPIPFKRKSYQSVGVLMLLNYKILDLRLAVKIHVYAVQ